MFMMAERSRCEDFESVLEQVSGRAHSGFLVSRRPCRVLTAAAALPGTLKRELVGMIRGRLAVDTGVGR